MTDESANIANEGSFIDQATAIVLENAANEQFGVSELAEAMHMSRSNLLRKIKKDTELSASQFIRRIRIEKGMEILDQTSLTVSEVSFKVGFGSTSYFIKCFREFYGYPPGEVGVRGAVDKSQRDSSARHRQLAAIMFTDIEGYTSLMQKDESKAIAFRDRHREVFDSTTRKFKGRILQYYGDGTLSTFPSAIDAVQCGIEMQLAFKEEPTVPIRIGIHSGDIIVTDDDIIGDGVNVASRIEALAEVGTVYISEKVYDEIKNQPELLTASKGVHTLKNVTKPLEVYAVTNYELGGIDTSDSKVASASGAGSYIKWSIIAAVIVLLGVLAYTSGIFQRKSGPNAQGAMVEKSIAVLPFKNDSNDSTNLYFVNGLMESALSNLQKIEDLRVVSRTSVEKYRDTEKGISEIAEELNVSYVIEGSGQRVGDQVMLSIQLIEAASDRHIWAEQYTREVGDIFTMQHEVASKIATAIEAVVTPAELEQIEKKPTENLEAYDYYLQALGPYHSGTNEGYHEAITLFKTALEYDPQFALAYAEIAISYYFLDLYQAEKQYTELLNSYADKALLYDSKSAESLIAKALYYMQIEDYRLALPHLEKALEYNPNSNAVVQMLANLYAHTLPNTAKYLEYALKGIQLDIAASDSSTRSYIYLSLSNALAQTGFMDQALKYIDLSLDMDSNNYYAPYVKAMILFAKNQNLEQMQSRLMHEWNKDTTRMDLLQEVAKSFYFQENYDSAFYYFDKFVQLKEQNDIYNYPQEDIRIGVIYEKMGLNEQAAGFFQSYTEYCEGDESIYQSASLAIKYAHEQKFDLAIEQLNIFATQENYQYWMLVFFELDPLTIPLRTHPEYQETLKKMEDRFWENQAELKQSLEDKDLI